MCVGGGGGGGGFPGKPTPLILFFEVDHVGMILPTRKLPLPCEEAQRSRLVILTILAVFAWAGEVPLRLDKTISITNCSGREMK